MIPLPITPRLFRKAWVCFWVILLMSIPGMLRAAYEIEWTPGVTLSQSYDDNIYLDDQFVEDDWLTTVSPKLLVSASWPRSTVKLYYAPQFVFYKANADQNVVRHTLYGDLRHYFAKRFYVSLTEVYTITDDPLEFDRDSQTVATGRQTYCRNTTTALGHYQFGKRDIFEAGYQYSALEGDTDDPFNTVNTSEAHRMHGNLRYWFDIRNGIDLLGSLTRTRYRSDFSATGSGRQQLDSYDTEAGYSHRFNRRTDLRAGYQLAIRNGTTDAQSYRIHTGNLRLKYKFLEASYVQVAGGPYYRDQADGQGDSGAAFSAEVAHAQKRLTLRAGAEYGWDEDYLDIEARGFTRYRQARASVEYKFLRRLDGYAVGNYRWNESLQDEVTENYRARCGMRFILTPWLVLNLEYQYARRRSEVPGEAYENNRYTASLSATQNKFLDRLARSIP